VLEGVGTSFSLADLIDDEREPKIEDGRVLARFDRDGLDVIGDIASSRSSVLSSVVLRFGISLKSDCTRFLRKAFRGCDPLSKLFHELMRPLFLLPLELPLLREGE